MFRRAPRVQRGSPVQSRANPARKRRGEEPGYRFHFAFQYQKQLEMNFGTTGNEKINRMPAIFYSRTQKIKIDLPYH